MKRKGMKTIGFVVIALILPATVFAAIGSVNVSCADNDPTNDIYYKGIVRINDTRGHTKGLSDVCRAKTKLIQYSCVQPPSRLDSIYRWINSITVNRSLVTCSGNCFDGACVSKCGNVRVEPGEDCELGQQQQRTCGTDVGECQVGQETRTCSSQCQWSSYQNCNAVGPTPEVCDGKDNDCNGVNDNGFNNENCQPVCTTSGFVWTGHGGNLNCCGNDPHEDDPYQINETLCDGNDNDCNGYIDENVCPTLPENCISYDDFSAETLNNSKWVESSVLTFADEHFVSNGTYHVEQFVPGDHDTTLSPTHDFLPGESFVYDIIYHSGTGNHMYQLKIEDMWFYNWAPPYVCPTPLPGCSGIGYWNGVPDLGNQTGIYHVRLVFGNNSIDMDITRPDDTIFSYKIINVVVPVTVGMKIHTGHNGIMHFDVDNVSLCN